MTRHSYLPLLFMIVITPLLPAQQGDDPKKKKDGAPMPEGLKALQHPDAKVRYRAAQTLADLGPQAKFAAPELRELLRDKNLYVRVKAAEALWKIEKTPASILLPVLLDALKDKEAGVRALAPPVIALLGSKAKPALPLLVQLLGDKELDVKLSAIAALGELGSVAKESAKDLLALTADKDFFLLEPFVGAALANLGDSVLPTLAQALADPSAERRRVAAYALGSMGRNAAPVADGLAKALQADDAATRILAARALGKIGPEAQKCLEKLEAALTDKEAAVRIEIALATWCVSGKPTHTGVIVKALADPSVNVREAACQALGAMKAKEAVAPLLTLLQDKDLHLRAIMTLGEIGPPADRALGELKKGLTDKDAEMAGWSAFAVWQVTGKSAETLPVLKNLLGTEAHYNLSIRLLGEMGEAAQSVLPTLVALYREEDNVNDRRTLAAAIKKIDAKAAMKLGIR
jgi:HEAT repeat protein